MGDDTFHCIGTVMETERGLGMIGLHRGKSQTDFDAAAFGALNRNLIHLRRMLTVRARLSRNTAQIGSLAALLDANPTPMLAITEQGRIIHANVAAQALMASGSVIRERNGRFQSAVPTAEIALAQAIARATDAAAPVASMVVVTAPDGRQVELTLSPVNDRGMRLVLVAGRDPDGELRRALMPVDAGETLAPREVMIARHVAMGLRNREIADRMGLTEGTVKVYLNTLFTKVGVTNRTELALRAGGALVNGV